jgi:hypothetical protein
MGFLSPWYLVGLVAVGLPIWLHLLRRHRSTPLPFSSLMFFERRTQSSIKHRRLHYLLLFALRTALLVLLALAFANPFVTHTALPGAGGRKQVLLAIDNSFSMRQGNRLGRAKREAVEALSRMQGRDQAQVLSFASQVHVLSQPDQDQASLRAAIQTIEPTDSRGSYTELTRALRSIAKSSSVPLEVHLFSDMQKSSIASGFSDLALAPNTGLVLHPVADSRVPNWTVESVTVPTCVYELRKVRVQAVVAGFGTPAATRTVSLVLNGRVLETKTVPVPENGRAGVEFNSLEAPFGFNRGEVRIDSGDSFPADDRFNFSIERADPHPVLFVRDGRDTRSQVYFGNALGAASEAAFRLENVTTDQVANLSPSKYAFVVLSDAALLPAGFADALGKYVRGGGSLLIALGPAATSGRRIPVFDENLRGERYSSRDGDLFQAIAWVDPAHPSIRLANNWEGVKFYQVARVEPGSAKVVARLADQTPVLLEKRVGQGRVIVFASAFDNLSNDFPLHASFVPFVQETARYLASLDDAPRNLTVDSDQAQGGFHQVRQHGRQELVAVNADRRESDFDLIPAETLALWQHTGQESAATGGSAPEQKPNGLWWYALLAALALAVGESLVAAGLMGQTREQAESGQPLPGPAGGIAPSHDREGVVLK